MQEDGSHEDTNLFCSIGSKTQLLSFVLRPSSFVGGRWSVVRSAYSSERSERRRRSSTRRDSSPP